jgi:ribosomal protein S18 acetylase RimI-like enzyme
MNITRLATLNDIDSLCRLYTDFHDYNASQQPNFSAAVIESGDYSKASIESDTDDIFVAIADDNIVGFVHVLETSTKPYPSIVAHKYAEIIDFFVLDDYRKKGIGKQLLNDVKNWAKSRGLEYIELMALSNNDLGIGFYVHEGFEIASHNMRLSI